jgi:hypothetical protein
MYRPAVYKPWNSAILIRTLTERRQIDNSISRRSTGDEAMTTAKAATHRERQIVGFSLAPSTARAVKAEAGRRGLSLRKLFDELWQLYQEKYPKATS